MQKLLPSAIQFATFLAGIGALLNTYSASPTLTTPTDVGLRHANGHSHIKEVAMRRGQLRFVIVCCAVSLFAFITVSLASAQNDPLIGTWKLNLAKSKYTPGPPPKSQTITYAPAANGLKATVDGVEADGKRMAYGYTAMFDGKDYPEPGVGVPNGADTIGGLKRVDANTVESVGKKGGKVVQTTKRVVSKDGKTLTITTTGTNEKGQKTNTVTVYDKQ
jgi:hypothetical protein